MIDMTIQLRKIIEALYLNTNRQIIEWSIDQPNRVCETSLGDGYVQVLESADEDGDYFSYVRILNNTRDIVDTIYGGSLGKNSTPVNTGHANYWELMRDLYSSAKRSALGADRVVSSIVTALNADGLDMDEIPF